jgi:hypothetical protein
MVGRLDEQMRRGHAGLPVVIADGKHKMKEVQDLRVVVEDGVPVRIELFVEFDFNHIT